MNCCDGRRQYYQTNARFPLLSATKIVSSIEIESPESQLTFLTVPEHWRAPLTRDKFLSVIAL